MADPNKYLADIFTAIGAELITIEISYDDRPLPERLLGTRQHVVLDVDGQPLIDHDFTVVEAAAEEGVDEDGEPETRWTLTLQRLPGERSKPS